MKYQDGIDFILVAYGDSRYVELNIKSIEKFISVPYTVYVVVNYNDKSSVKLYQDLFKNNKNVKVFEGINQTEVDKVIGSKNIGGKIDDNQTRLGSYYGAWGVNKVIKKGKRKYVCRLDNDSIILSSYFEKIIDLTEKHAIISHRWDSGNVFVECLSKGTCTPIWEDGIARPMFIFSKRKLYDDILKEEYVKNGVWTTEPWNVDYRDVAGNLTWYCKQKGLTIYILKNSYRDYFRVDNGLWKEHILDMPKGEQAWLDDVPIWFHKTRGGISKKDKRTGSVDKWIEECNKFLEIKGDN